MVANKWLPLQNSVQGLISVVCIDRGGDSTYNDYQGAIGCHWVPGPGNLIPISPS